MSSSPDALQDTDRPNFLSIIGLILLHSAAILALFNFTWKALIVAALLHWVAMSWGICCCYHRLLTHRGFKTSKAFEYFLAVCGTLALEGGPLSWVATHRIHHQFSDRDGDPHTPLEGTWWAHAGWLLVGNSSHTDTQQKARFCPDLASDRFYIWLNTYHFVPLLILSVILYFVGGLPMILWGVGMRIVIGLHGTWLVNSATHMWGKRRFETRDNSRNSFWVAMVTYGEGWHNNHHAHPVSARHGLAWYEIDFTWMLICAFRMLGLVRDPYVPQWQNEG